MIASRKGRTIVTDKWLLGTEGGMEIDCKRARELFEVNEYGRLCCGGG